MGGSARKGRRAPVLEEHNFDKDSLVFIREGGKSAIEKRKEATLWWTDRRKTSVAGRESSI